MLNKLGIAVLISVLIQACSLSSADSLSVGLPLALNPITTSAELGTGIGDNPSSAPVAEHAQQQVITILYTSDEHGWMEGVTEGRGAANLLGVWQDKDNYTPDGSFLVFSGGDMWTGPAISTWFQGQSMVEAMNALGYDAATVGNHDFDFGLEALKTRTSEMKFPLLAANIHNKKDGSYPNDLGIKPYFMVKVSGVPVGIIGLASTQTPLVTNPVNVARFTFGDYAETLRQVVPDVRQAGAKMVVVVSHLCRDELLALANNVQSLSIDMIGGGHCHEWYASQINNIVILGGGSQMANYAYAQFTLDTGTKKVVNKKIGTGVNKYGTADRTISNIVSGWKSKAEKELDVVVGYTRNGFSRRNPELPGLIVGAWLAEYPADIALTNLGGIRQDIHSGDITIGDIVGVMPFDNVIIAVKLTGAELEKVMAGRQDSNAVAGMSYRYGEWILTASGMKLSSEQTYTVLVNDFMYAGGDGFTFAAYDPLGYNTGIDWRQPVIDWLTAQNSNKSNPIDAAVEGLIK